MYHYISHEWGLDYENWLAAEQAVFYANVIHHDAVCSPS